MQHPFFNGISASLKSMANSHAGAGARRSRNVRQMNMFGSTESLHEKQSDKPRLSSLYESIERDDSPYRFQQGAAAQPSLNIHGSQASITNMGSGVKSMQPSGLGYQDESDKDKENKFSFNPRVSKYGQGFVNL